VQSLCRDGDTRAPSANKLLLHDLNVSMVTRLLPIPHFIEYLLETYLDLTDSLFRSASNSGLLISLEINEGSRTTRIW